MNKLLCIAFAFLALQALLSEAGLIKKFVTGVVGGSENSAHTTQNYGQSGSYDEYKRHSLWSVHYNSGADFHSRDTKQPYKNTSWHIENEDYLTPNRNESSLQKERPSSGYGGGGTYNRRLNVSQPAFHEDFSTVRANIANNNQNGMNKNNDNLNGSPEIMTANTAKNLTETAANHTDIILQSNSITCLYSNLRDKHVENRNMICNEKDCHLEKTFEKSSLWICGDIKCTVANVDFLQTDKNKKLIECSMDGRNIITGQDKPVKCGKDEKVHNGRCRQVYGK